MKPTKPGKTAKRSYQRHGLCLMKRAAKELGSRAIDRRTSVGKALAEWRAEILRDLGGVETVSAQCQAVLDVAVTTKLLLGGIDSWLLRQPSLVNVCKRCLFPVVLQRQQLADALVKYMTVIVLERKAPRVPALNEYLALKEAGRD
jgi:hypothetical protein